MSANRILDRALRRAESAHRAARTGHRRAVGALGLGRDGGRARRVPRQRRGAVAGCAWRWRRSPWPARPLLLRQAVHRRPAGAAGARAVRRAGRRVARGDRGTGAAPVALGVAVGTWIGGFDLIYSCQDAEIDRRIGSRSFPARFGIPAALRASSVVHVVTVAAFALVRRRRRARLAVVDGRRADRRRPGVRARDRPRRRPLPRQPRVLHRQRRHRHRPVRVRARDLIVHGLSAMRTPWVVGVSGASGTPYARSVLNGLLDAREPVDLSSPAPPG